MYMGIRSGWPQPMIIIEVCGGSEGGGMALERWRTYSWQFWERSELGSLVDCLGRGRGGVHRRRNGG